MIAAYVGWFSYNSICLHNGLHTHTRDLGNMDQPIWNTAHGHILEDTRNGFQATRLTDHVEMIFIPLSLGFYLWNDVRLLLVIQTLALGAGGWLVYLLARRLLPEDASRWLAPAAVAAYLLFPALEAANLTEFHAIPLAVPLILAAFYTAELDSPGWFVASILVLDSVKEEAALLGFMLSLWALVRRRDERRWLVAAATSALASILWFVAATFVIIPHYSATVYGEHRSIYFKRYGELGNSIADIVRSLLFRPGLVWRVATQPSRLRYIFLLLAPAGGLALLSPDVLLVGFPLFLANLLSTYPAQYSGEFHYSAPLVPFVIVGALYACSRILRRRAPRWVAPALAVWLLIAAGGMQVAHGWTPLGREFRCPPVTAHDRLLNRFLAEIPPDVPGSTTPSLYPHLSHRRKLYEFPTVADAQWVLLEVNGTTDMHPVDFRNRYLELVRSGEFGVADAADGYILLKRGVKNRTLPDEFYSFARARNPHPAYPHNLVFGEKLRFLGFDVSHDGKWNLTSVRLYFRPLAPLPKETRLWPFFLSADGKVAEDTSQRPPVVPLWYPPARWRVGETVVVETVPWFLPDRWALALGVFQGSDWAHGKRWKISGDDPRADAFPELWARMEAFRAEGRKLRPFSPHEIGEPSRKASADIGPFFHLEGWDVQPAKLKLSMPLEITLFWRTMHRPDRDYTVFIHLRDVAGRNVAQVDAQPAWFGPEPTTWWTAGSRHAAAFTLQVPKDLPRGTYRLVMGMYWWKDGKRLPVVVEGKAAGDEIVLGRMSRK